MSAIRPDIFAATQARAATAAPLPDAARQAQAAFFRAAMGGAPPAPQASVASAQVQPAAVQAESVRSAFAQALKASDVQQTAAPQPSSGRPGGLLDIRV